MISWVYNLIWAPKLPDESAVVRELRAEIRALRAENAKLRKVATAHTVTWDPAPENVTKPKITWVEQVSERFAGIPSEVFAQAAKFCATQTHFTQRVMVTYQMYVSQDSPRLFARLRGKDPGIGGWTPHPWDEGLARYGFGDVMSAHHEAETNLRKCNITHPEDRRFFVYPWESVILRVTISTSAPAAPPQPPEVRFVEVPIAVTPESDASRALREVEDLPV